MATIAPYGIYQAFDDNGDPLAGGFLYTYEAGTDTPKATYTTADGDVENDNPVELDASGQANVWLGDGGYKFVLKDADNVTIFTTDDIGGTGSEAFGAEVNTLTTNTSINTTYANSANICTGTITLSLLPASSAGEGFYFTVKNQGSGIVTIDPDAGELIDGASTLAIPAGTSALIITNGTAWWSFFLATIMAAANNTFTGTNTFSNTVTMNGAALNEAKGSDIASATTTNIGAATGNFVHITGTTTITGFGTVQAGTRRIVKFDSALTLTHNATSLILPGGANITTSANDVATFVSEGSGNWRCTSYMFAAGVPIAATQAEQETGTSLTSFVTPGRQKFHPSAAKAWVNFNGAGTLAIRTSFNVTSVTDSGTGIYIVNFTTAFSSADYAVAGWGRIINGGTNSFCYVSAGTGQANPTASACPILTANNSAAAADFEYVTVVFFGDQ